jgi:diadenosine tetraphosphate (Ap4A) HIT family hydrolase
MPKSRIIAEDSSAFAVYDGYPVTELHSLIIPKRHVSDIWELTTMELSFCWELICRQKDAIKSQDNTVAGFNIGVNVGGAAGQTVFHAHIHLIPRRVGDIDEPRGGVRGVIPSKRAY